MKICINLKSNQFKIKKKKEKKLRFINLFISCNNLCIFSFVKDVSFYFEMFVVLVIPNEYIPFFSFFFLLSLSDVYTLERWKAERQRCKGYFSLADPWSWIVRIRFS